MNRKILSVLIVLIFALSMSTVVAADADNTDLTIANDSNGLDKTFASLQDAIDDTNVNGICTLEDDYMYYPLIDMKYKDGVTINKNITIDGQGHTINGFNLARIFNIENNGNYTVTVTLKNLILINGKTNDNGGAILINEGNATFLKCDNVTFNNCKADNGGAIYANKNGYLNITNSIFTDNEAKTTAGAIYSLNNNETISTVNIYKSAFINNQANKIATIISCYNITANYNVFDSKINKNMTFIKVNSINDLNETALARNFWGINNPIISAHSGYVLDPSFANRANSIVIPVKSWIILELNDTISTKVTDEGYRGFVNATFKITNGTDKKVLTTQMPDYTVTVKTDVETLTDVVKNNIAEIEFEVPGLAFNVILVNNNDKNITKQNYTASIPENSFSALAENLTKGMVIIFDKNYKYYQYFDKAYINGLVINNEGTVIKGNGFSISGSNLARIFYVNTTGVDISNLTLKNGYALTGAAIYATENIGTPSFSGLKNNYFINNRALKGAAIYTEKSITLTNNYFTDNVAFNIFENTYGGAIYAIGNVKVFKGSFIRNSAMYGAAIYAQGDISATSSIFDGNVGPHGVIYSMSTVSTVDNCYWGNNYDDAQEFIDAGFIFADDVAKAPNQWVLLKFNTPLYETPQFFRTYTISLTELSDGGKLRYQDYLPDYTVNLIGLGVFNNNTLSIFKIHIPVVSKVNITKGDGEFQFAIFTNSFISVRNSLLQNVATNYIGTKAYTFSEYQQIINEEGKGTEYVPVIDFKINQTRIDANILLEDVVFNPLKDLSLALTGLVISEKTHIVGFSHEIVAYGLTPAFTVLSTGKLLLTTTHIENTSMTAIINYGKVNAYLNKIEGNIVNFNNLKAHLNIIRGNIFNNGELSVYTNLMFGHVIFNNGTITSLCRVNIIDTTGAFGIAGNFTAYLTDDLGNFIIPNNATNVVLTDQYGALYNGIKVNNTFVFNYPGTLDVEIYHFTSEVNNINKTIALGTLTIAPKDSFSALNILISKTPENGVLNLTRNYKYYNKYDYRLNDGIVISKNITINGNGYTIDAQNDARIFNVTAEKARFDNIVFANGEALAEGAAIYTENSLIIVGENNTFTNNDARFGRGGAIYNKEGNIAVIFNNTFVNNKGTYGGAIYTRNGNIAVGALNKFINNTAISGEGGALSTINGDIKVDTLNSFNGNVALAGLETSHGGAIDSINGEITIGNYNLFTNNVAERGGAISSGNNLTIANYNVFINNSAVSFGGAIYAHGISLGDNNTFKSNFAANGGAMAVMDTETNYDINIKGMFIGNSAVNGGAIYTQTKLTIDGILFENNTALFNGGAIFVSGNGPLNVNNSIFIGNSASMNGGAIHSHGNVNIVDNNFFVYNVAMNGGAIYLTSDNLLTIGNNNKFSNNSAVLNGGAIDAHNIAIYGSDNYFMYNTAFNGGAINTGDITINQLNNFAFNSAHNGGAIYANGAVTIDYGVFYYNVAANGGALYLANNNATIVESYFINNTAGDGSDIYAYYERLTLRDNIMNGTIFLRHSVITTPVSLNIVSGVDEKGIYHVNGTLRTADGAAVVVRGGFNLVDNEGNIYLCNLLTSENGVYNFIVPILLHSGEYTFENTTIDGIEQLNVMGSLTIIPPEDSFAALYEKIKNSNGTVELDRDYNYYAIRDSHLQNGIPIENDVIINGNGYTINAKNFARIFDVSADKFVLNNVNLINGKALAEGAAIYTENSTIICNNTSFRNNDALFGRGGAIYNKEGKTIIDYNNQFIDNGAMWGGAIYSRLGNTYIIRNNTFIDNHAINGNGGAISTVDGNVIVEYNNKFINNTAISLTKNYGGAIDAYHGNLTILNNNLFDNNMADCGGAIACMNNVKINSYNIFRNNYAVLDGGVLHNPTNTEINQYNAFISNHANRYGGVIYTKGDVTINGSAFISNDATKGGSLYTNYSDVNIINSAFIENSAVRGGNIAIYNSDVYIENCYFKNNTVIDGHTDCFTDSTVTMNKCIFNYTDDMYYSAIHFNNSDVSLNQNKLNVTIDNTNSTFLSPVVLNISSYYNELFGKYRVIATLTADGAYVLNTPFNLVDDEGNVYDYRFAIGETYFFVVPEDLESGIYTFENTEIEGMDDLEINGNLTIESHYAIDAHYLIKYYGSSDKLEAVVTDNGRVVSGVNVTFTINGKTYIKTTDENGIARLAINLPAGSYKANVSFGNVSDSTFVYVKSTIDIEDFTKVYGEAGAFEAKFCDQYGHDLVYKQIKYNINGVFYTHTTDADGVDHLNINLLPGEYIITVYNLFTGEETAAKVTVLEPTNQIVA